MVGKPRARALKHQSKSAKTQQEQATLDPHVVPGRKDGNTKKRGRQQQKNYGILATDSDLKSQSQTPNKSSASCKKVKKSAPSTPATKKRREFKDVVSIRGEKFHEGDTVYIVIDDSFFQNYEEEDHNYTCEGCDKHGTAKNVLLECSRCLGGWHLSCVDPPIEQIPEDDWVCPNCEAGKPVQTRAAKCARELVLQQKGVAVGRIERMWEVAKGQHEFCMRWYCLPEETYTGRQPHHAAKEIFLTQQRDESSMETIVRRCHVLDPKSYHRNDLKSDDVFMCEYEYDSVYQRFRRRGSFMDSDSGDEWSGMDGEDSSSDDDEAIGFVLDEEEPKHKHRRQFAKRALLKDDAFLVGTSAIPEHVRDRSKSDPLVQARNALTLAAAPRNLPCRENERATVTEFVEEVLAKGGNGSGKCLYISGIPGTGKTATVLEVMRQMRSKAEAGTVAQFQFVEVNGLRLPSPQHAYSCLLEALTGERAGPTTAQHALERLFKSRTGSKNRRPIILLLDEMDLLINRTQTVLYNMFDWPLTTGSGISIIGIANTMDLPERLLPRIGSRMAGHRLVFHPYKRDQLVTIVKARLDGISAFEESAVTFVARKVANASGDVRRCLELCRRAAEIAHESQLNAAAGESSAASSGKVAMRHVDTAIREAFSTSHVRQLREACRLERLLLASVHLDARYTGRPEVVLESAISRLRQMCTANNEPQYPVGAILECLISLGAKRLVICDPGWKRLKAKVALNVPTDDLNHVLTSDDELPWLAHLLQIAEPAAR